MIAIGNQLESAFVQSLVGTRQQVLFETQVGNGLWEGYTPQYARVRAQAGPGELCQVRLERAQGAVLYASKL